MQTLSLKTGSRTEFVDITNQVQAGVSASGIEDGLVYVYVPHTTAAVTINEGADPAVQRDILAIFNSVVPSDFGYLHREGNSPAHIKTSLVGPGVLVIIEEGRLRLGTWQRIFFCEFDGPRTRSVWIKAVG